MAKITFDFCSRPIPGNGSEVYGIDLP